MKTGANEPLLGKFLNWRYQIVQPLSAGAFGQTYIAEDTWSRGNPQCVVKHLQPKGDDPRRWQICERQFTNEAEALKKLGDHYQIPQLIDSFEDKQGFYLVQELIVGEPLSAELPISKYCDKRWSESQCIEMLQDVLSVLEFVHSQDIIHCDLKPNNLLRRTSDGRIILIDFGGAYQIPPTQIKPQVIPIRPYLSSGAISPLGYIPIEQLSGQPCPSSDLYALGMIAIEALTGLTPLQLDADPETGEVLWQKDVPVTDRMACLLNHMVCYDPKDRYQSAADARKVLKRLMLRSEKRGVIKEELSEEFVSYSLPVVPPIVLAETKPMELCLHNVSRPNYSQSRQPSIKSNSSAVVEESDRVSSFTSISAMASDELAYTLLTYPTGNGSAATDAPNVANDSLSLSLTESIGAVNSATEKLAAQTAGAGNAVSESKSSSRSKKWSDAREIAFSCCPKLPPMLAGVGAGMTTSNALAISFGLYTLLHAAPSNPGLELLVRATEKYQSGNLDEAIALANSIPSDSSAYQESVKTRQKWRQEWKTAANQFKAVEEAFIEERWRDVLEEAHKTPNIAFWQQKIEPFVEQAKPQIEAEAQQLLELAYKQAALKDFTGALALLKQISPDTPTGAKIKPKLTEYSQKQQIKADSLLQKAYDRASKRDFNSALKYLSEIPEDTPVYEAAQLKIAEYSLKQNFKEEAQRQAELNAPFPKQEIKVTTLSKTKSPQRPNSSKKSKNLNPGSHLQEVSPKRVLPTPTKR
ncbi:MAG TPA: protein kinase [Coleofasciculaceae cyanobacterium]